MCIAVTQSLAVDQRPKHAEPVQDFRTTIPPTQSPGRNVHQAQPPQPQQQNWSGNQQQQIQQNWSRNQQQIQQNWSGNHQQQQNWSGNQQQQQMQQNWSGNQQHQIQPMDGCYMAPMGGPQYASQHSGGGAPGGGAQRRSGELKSPPVIQPQHNASPMNRNQHAGGTYKDRIFLVFHQLIFFL